jgi:perosamine synthetase
LPAPSTTDTRGGEGPVTHRIPHSRPALGALELEKLREVISSGVIAQGPRVEQLEGALASHLRQGTRETSAGVAVSSGTAALYVSLRALGVETGDEVLMPAFVCASVLQAVRATGAMPRFVDCDPATFNVDPDDAKGKVGERTKAIIVAHLFGLPADLEPLLELGPPVIEDCAQTLGASYRGHLAGTLGEITTCSFYATKLLAAGEGGMVLSTSAELLERVRRLRNCDDPASGEWAFNFKMSDLHAAVGLAQLEQLPESLARRKTVAHRYCTAFEKLPVGLPASPDDREHQYFRFVVALESGRLGPLLERSEQLGLACRRPVGYLPEPVRAELDNLPGCQQAWRTACSIPLYPSLADDEVELVMSRFEAALRSVNA